MQKMIFKKKRFSKEAMRMLEVAQHIASSLGEEKACCSHLLAAITYLAPEVIEDILGTNISDWINEYNLDWKLVLESGKATQYADELCALLIDTTEESPLNFIKGFFPDRIIGPAELAFIILKEPTEEIIDIISQYDINNNAGELGELLERNYLACCEKHSGKTPRERLQACIEIGKRFSAFMNARIEGQHQAIEELTTSLVNFWYRGNRQKPMSVLLLSGTGCGKSFFAHNVQEAFVELGLQKEIYSALDMSCFTHNEAADCELLGEDKSYKSAHPGKIYDISKKNRRGAVVFENVQFGCESSKRILSALTQNHAYDKYYQTNVCLPFNVLIFTMTLEENKYDFLMKNGVDTLDAQHLSELLRDNSDNSANCRNNEFALINSVQDFICLKELDCNSLKEIVKNGLKSLEECLQSEYKVSLVFNGGEELVNLLLQSSPNRLTPKELTATMIKQLAGVSKSIIRYPEIETIELQCENLPDYPHEIYRRTVRGDYLTFEKREKCDGNKYIISFEKIKYCTQKSVDCGAYRIERPKNLCLNDIVGLDDLKLELQDALDFITGKNKNANIPPPALGYILAGEPGTGKSATIAALASNCDIPVFFANSAVFSDAKKIDDLFTKAKKMSPAIIVMDELNSIGNSSQPWRVEAINTLLAHMDGVEESSKLLVLGSTNYINQIEVALRRPGRFSRIIQVGLPEPEARDQYIRKFEKQYSFELTEQDRQFLVRLTEGKTIAVMKGVLEHALRTSARSGENLTSDKLEAAYNHIICKNCNSNNRSIGFNGGYER